jgi:aspartate/methionine/tyrosine aminotransferase
MAELLGLSVTAVELDAADDFAFNAARVASAVTSHTKAIIFCSPCNPTGRIYNQANLKELADLTATTGVWLVADETYRDFYYTVEPPASIGDVSDRAVVVRSFSKNCAMTGFRIGYLIGAEPLVDAVISVQRASLVCPPAISQRVALTALGNWSRWGDGMRGTYSILRETLLMAMAERLGWDIVPVEAGFFAFADIRRFGLNSAALARKVLDEADVVTVPGSAFGIGGEGYLRLSFSATPHQITTGIDRIARWVEGDIC